MKWGFTAKNFVLIVENEFDQETDFKLSFETPMASELVHVLNTILNIKQGKVPAPNNIVMNENVTREIYENNFFKKVNVFKKCQVYLQDSPEADVHPKEQEFETKN